MVFLYESGCFRILLLVTVLPDFEATRIGHAKFRGHELEFNTLR